MMLTFGDPALFAMKVLPLSAAPPDPDPAAAVTWVGLQIWADDENLCAHTDLARDRVVHHVNWPAIYLARWFVRAWRTFFVEAPWPIASLKRNALDVSAQLDARLASSDDFPEDEFEQLVELRDRFLQGHALHSGAAGGLLPPLFLSRHGDMVRVAWSGARIDRAVFHSRRGELDVPAGVFEDTVGGFVRWVAETLASQASAPDDLAALREWESWVGGPEAARDAVLGLTGLAGRWSSLAARTGLELDAFLELPHRWEAQGSLVARDISPIAMAFRCLSPSLTDDDLIEVRRVVASVAPDERARHALDALAREVRLPFAGMPDFEQGYWLAGELRRALGNRAGALDVEALVRDELGIPITDIGLADIAIDGAAICDPAHGPAILVNRDSPRAAARWARRITIAHELCHLLFDRTRTRPVAILSGVWAPPELERRANAFAIELLLPKAGILETVGHLEVEPERFVLKQLCDKYSVGWTAAREHVLNRLGLR